MPQAILLLLSAFNNLEPPETATKSPLSSIPLAFNFFIPSSTVSSILDFDSTYTGYTFHDNPNWLNVLLLSVIAIIGHSAPRPESILALEPEFV